MEGNKKYRLERRLSEAGRFILCSVRDLEIKKIQHYFSKKGRDSLLEWNSLAERLRGLGVASTVGLKVSSGPEDPLRVKGGSKVLWREKGVELKSYANAIKSSLGRVAPLPKLEYVRSWTLQHWALKGNLRVAMLGKGLLLFDFELPSEAGACSSQRQKKY
ncbi:hypothetical protein CK203_108405 [Vitis vinifera]|uniref:DUF4283 domain-containing protein n=1 Tax=Vitis vinifera TaxID=29760 RepID=A0A438E276_VITVI|nr:hypothetical protein CK203_108405 [Vitis vinifera]